MNSVSSISPAEARRELERRRQAGSFGRFIAALCGDYQQPLLAYEHVPRLVDVAERVCRGYHKRVMVLLPPRYFKSQIFSRFLPAYYLHRYPTRHVGLASYSASLAWDLSGKARAYYEAAGGETARDTDAKKEWANTHGGKMWADGIGGSLTGKGFHLGVIDDPMKPKHARSRAYIDGFREWYPETWYNRQEPGAAMIVVMQRLGTNDPIDFLFRREVGIDTDAAPEHWHVVCCDEIKSDKPLADYDGPRGLPPTCTLEPDARATGAILAPSRFDRASVERQQRAAGVAAGPQRQQRATEAEGDVWRTHWFQVYGTPTGHPVDELPRGATGGGKDWDTAYTKDESNSATAYVESYAVHDRQGDTDVYITACDWRWLEVPDIINWMRRAGGPHYVEAKASGKSIVQTLRRERVPVTEVDVEGGDKYARTTAAQPVAGYLENDQPVSTGRVYVHASLYDKLISGDRQGLANVTYEDLRAGTGDLDLNDAFVQAINRHTSRRRAPRMTIRSRTGYRS